VFAWRIQLFIMFANLFGLAVLALPLASASPFPQRRQSGWPAPEPCNGNCTFIHDPAVIRDADSGTYYRFSTNGNIAIATADDLTGPWTYQGALLPDGSSITVTDGQEMWVSIC
jgi:arabinan endo-1,5-alpha-L-arabinosidase